MCIEDGRGECCSIQVFLFCLLVAVDNNFLKISACSVRCLRWKGWNIFLTRWFFLHVKAQVGEYATASWLLRHLPCVCYQRRCDALGISLALSSMKSSQEKHQAFSSSSVFHFLMKMEDVNKVRLLEMLMSSWKSWCLHFFLPMLILTMNVLQVCLIGLLRPVPFSKCKTKDRALSWTLISPSNVSCRWGCGQAWMRAVGGNKAAWFFSEILGNLWSNWK